MGYQGSDGRWHEREDTAIADSEAQARVAGIDWGSWESRLKDEAAKAGVGYDASDLQSLKTNIGYDRPTMSLDQLFANRVSNYADRASSERSGGGNGGGGGGGGSSDGGGGYPTGAWQAAEAERKARADALYGELVTRSQQGLAVNANDPLIRQQSDVFNAAQERSRRNYLSDIAERSGPYANLRGEQRMTAEKAGQASGAFVTELMAREVAARRDEIQQALLQRGDMLSGDQQVYLRQQLADLDAMLQRERMALDKYGLDQGNDLSMRQLARLIWKDQDESAFNWAGL